MIWGLTVGNHFVPSQASFLCSPVYSHQLREWHFGDFLLLNNCSFGACSIFVSNYSRRYYFKFLLILGMSLKKAQLCACLFMKFQLY